MPHFIRKLAVTALLVCTVFTSAFAAELPSAPRTLSEFEAVWDYAAENNSDRLEFHYTEKSGSSEFKKCKDMIELMLKEYRYMYPDKFNYLGLEDCSFVDDEDEDGGFTMVLDFKDLSSTAKMEYYAVAVEKAEELYHEVTDKLSPTLSQKNRARILCEAIKSRVTYKNDHTDLCHTAYCALVNGYAVCDGYTSLYNMLLRMDGIECIGRRGDTTEGLHEWTYAKLDGEWVNIDSTWVCGSSGYKYFGVTDEEIAETHTPFLDYIKLREKVKSGNLYVEEYYSMSIIKNRPWYSNRIW